MGQMSDVRSDDRGMTVGVMAVVPARLPSWGFYALQCLEITENGAIKKRPVSSGSVAERTNKRGQSKQTCQPKCHKCSTNSFLQQWCAEGRF